MLTFGRVVWNSWMKIGVRGAIARGVRIEIKTKTAWLIITVTFHVLLQFYDQMSQ